MYIQGSDYGFLIRDASENNRNGYEQQFHSREKGENPPELVITFAPLAPWAMFDLPQEVQTFAGQ
jgi:hypothetical protein